MEYTRGWKPGAYIHHISPTPLLLTVPESDSLLPMDATMKAYGLALEPKELNELPGGHFDAYCGPNFERNAGRQVEFLKKTLCA